MKQKIFTLLTALIFSLISFAQNFDSPVAYMDAIENARLDMDKKYMAYISAASHGKRARKVEKLRLQAVDAITKSKYSTIALPFYKGDNSLRQSSIENIDFCYKIFNDDYAKIVNMEEIAEQSFDEMQAYILLKEKVDEKLKEANAKLFKAQTDFAAKYNVTLVEGKSELGEKMSITSKVNAYFNKVYLVFFKCNWQDNELTKALNNHKLNDAEQARSSLLKFVAEGLVALDSLKTFSGDATMSVACRTALLKYKQIAEKETPKITDFFLKQENFEKMKKEIEKKKDRTKVDVDTYNKAVKEFNEAVNISNKAGEACNKLRNEIINDWENAEKDFFDRQIPYFKK